MVGLGVTLNPRCRSSAARKRRSVLPLRKSLLSISPST